MNIIFYLPSVSNYRDRISMLKNVADRTNKFFLIIGFVDENVQIDNKNNFYLINAGFSLGKYFSNIYKVNKIVLTLLKKESIDIVHDTFGVLLPTMLLGSKKVKYCESLFCLQNWRLFNVFLGREKIWNLIFKKKYFSMIYGSLIERLFLKFADYIILQAEGLKERLKKYNKVSDFKIKVIPNNIDTYFWIPSEKTNNNKLIKLLFVGGIHFSKGIFIMIQLLKLMKQRGYDVELNIVGQGKLDKQTEDDVKLNKLNACIKFYSNQSAEDIRKMYQNFDIFLYQTINDGSPRVILEAASCQIPIIASYHPGIEVIDPKEEFINYTNFGDVESIFNIIESFIKCPKYYLDRAKFGSKIIKENFSSEIIALKYVKLYESIIYER